MSEPRYRPLTLPVKRMICVLMVNNAGGVMPLQSTLFIQHDIPLNADLTRLTFVLLRICWPLLCAHYLTALKCHQRLKDRFPAAFKDCENVNNLFLAPNCSFHLRCTFAMCSPHSIIIMREAQLDKVYNGGFKCHSAGPDISLFDMESEWER